MSASSLQADLQSELSNFKTGNPVFSPRRLTRYRLTIEPWLRFLGVGRDSAVFQDQNILTIVQTVLADYQAGGAYQGAGKLEPVWRIDLADPSIYPLRSLTTQYQESDLAFIELLLEEGLFYWFEHTGDPNSADLGTHTLGSHTMVITVQTV